MPKKKINKNTLKRLFSEFLAIRGITFKFFNDFHHDEDIDTLYEHDFNGVIEHCINTGYWDEIFGVAVFEKKHTIDYVEETIHWKNFLKNKGYELERKRNDS